MEAQTDALKMAAAVQTKNWLRRSSSNHCSMLEAMNEKLEMSPAWMACGGIRK